MCNYGKRGPDAGCSACEKVEDTAAFDAAEIVRQMEEVLIRRFGSRTEYEKGWTGMSALKPKTVPALSNRVQEAWDTFRQSFEDGLVEDALDESSDLHRRNR